MIMCMIDVEELQKDVYESTGVPLLSEEMTFYYDESGNCRKFYLGSKGYNSPDALEGDFVLGGVVHEGKTYKIDVDKLHKAVIYNRTQKEMKFKYLYSQSSDFLSFMSSRKAINFLTWLSESGLLIHYTSLNNLYFSLVDIVDSLWDAPNNNEYSLFLWEIKNVLYKFTVDHMDEVTKLLIKHGYPDIKEGPLFCCDLRALISKHYSGNKSANILCKMLDNSEKYDELPFIQDNETQTLIEYYPFYLRQCQLFSKSFHIFDNEKIVQDEMSKIQLCEKGEKLNNWKFVDSSKNVFVQISDMVVGLLRKLFMYLDTNSLHDICVASQNLNNKQVKNFSMIRDLIIRSEKKSQYLFCNVSSPQVKDERWVKLLCLSHSEDIVDFFEMHGSEMNIVNENDDIIF